MWPIASFSPTTWRKSPWRVNASNAKGDGERQRPTRDAIVAERAYVNLPDAARRATNADLPRREAALP